MTSQSLKEHIGKIISYRNDKLGVGTIKKVVACRYDERYPNFLEVTDYPIKSNPNKYMVWFSDAQKKHSQERIKESGDWSINGEISELERVIKRDNKLK